MELSGAHVHLLLNHAPILGFAFGLFFLAWGRWKGSDEMVRAVLALYALVGLSTIAVFLSGEGAEEAVEELARVSHDSIEAHEEAGEFAMYASLLAGALSAIGLWRYRKLEVPGWLPWAAFVVGLVVFVLLAYAGFLGGQINHPEIQSALPSGALPSPVG